MLVTATEAKNRFGQMLDQCQSEPVVIEKAGRRHGVLLSARQYDELMARQPAPAKGRTGDDFYAQYKEWIDLQNEQIERHGIPLEEYRPW